MDILNMMIECIHHDVCLVVVPKVAIQLQDYIEDLELDCDDYRMSQENNLITIWRA